jgi:hypothetical protein
VGAWLVMFWGLKDMVFPVLGGVKRGRRAKKYMRNCHLLEFMFSDFLQVGADGAKFVCASCSASDRGGAG